MKRKSQGFTLMELVVVLVITGIMVIYAGYRLPFSTVFSLSAITEELKRDIRYTQSLAMDLSASYTITLLAGSYSISPTPPGGAVSVTMPTGVTLTPATITFDTLGNSGSSAYTITITATGVGSKTLTVTAETGYIAG